MTMSKKAQRIAIAKDVIKQIRLKTIVPRCGAYVRISDFDAEAMVAGADVKTLLVDKKLRNCRACALGSALLSKVRLFDKVKLGDEYPDRVEGPDPIFKIHHNFRGVDLITADRSDSELEPIFGGKQLDMIESAFEGSDVQASSGGVGITINEYQRAIVFNQRYQDDAQRLTAIMRNIVRHDGTFVPPKLSRQREREMNDRG